MKKHVLDLSLDPCVRWLGRNSTRLVRHSDALGLADGPIVVFPVNGGQQNNTEKADGNGFQQTGRAPLHVCSRYVRSIVRAGMLQ
jgi:hypothetical protein